MTANVVPFRKGPGSRLLSAKKSLPVVTQQQAEALHEARRKLSECWKLRAESRRIQRDYEERQRKIEDLMRRYDVERA